MPKRKIEIIHKASGFLVINKPPGVSVTKDRTGDDDILTILRKQMPDEKDLRLVHRLDKFTSGVMIVATTKQAQSTFSSMFEKRKIKKTYLAIVNGYIAKPSDTIAAPLAHSRKNPHLMRVDRKRGKPAITKYNLLADFGMVALLAVEPITIRTHQIRIHLSHKAMPLAIDPLYGSDRPIMLSDFKAGFYMKKSKPEVPLIDRLTLHAYQIEIPPLGDDPTTFIAGLDKKFAATVKMLTKHNPNGPDAFLDKEQYSAILNTLPI
jgi:RluA family pseudouridine synthase